MLRGVSKSPSSVKVSFRANGLNTVDTSSSSSFGGYETIPPNVVRCVVLHVTPGRAPLLATRVVKPRVLHSPATSSQYSQLILTEHWASRYCGGHTHAPSTHVPRPLQ